jgi:hypothetical protein
VSQYETSPYPCKKCGTRRVYKNLRWCVECAYRERGKKSKETNMRNGTLGKQEAPKAKIFPCEPEIMQHVSYE